MTASEARTFTDPGHLSRATVHGTDVHRSVPDRRTVSSRWSPPTATPLAVVPRGVRQVADPVPARHRPGIAARHGVGAVRAVAAGCLLGGVGLVLAAVAVASSDSAPASSHDPARPVVTPVVSIPAGATP